MTESQIAGLIVLVIGGLNAVRPDILLHIQIWVQRVIMRAEYKPSTRTYHIVRGIGVLFIIIGLLAITEVIK